MTDPARLRRWQAVTAASLFVGYAGYYVCRSNLSVATPLLLDEYGPGLTKGHVGDIASVGVLAYAGGKFVNGIATEYLGGRRLFLVGLFASVVCTVLFAVVAGLLFRPTAPAAAVAGAAAVAAVGVPAVALLPAFAVWGMNRFVQSMGWGGVVQIAGRWFPAGRLGTVMGVLCMSYLVGDAAARAALGGAVALGADWRGVFFTAAAVLAVIGVVNLLTLRGSPTAVGLPEPPPPPGNVYGDAAGGRVPLRDLLRPLAASRAFWLVCGMNVGLTLVRETFNLWNPTYLTEVAKLPAGTAGVTSLLFPLVGGLASFGSGWLVDRTGGRYARVMLPSLGGLVAALVALAVVPVGDLSGDVRPAVALGLIALVALFLIGPYTFCSGVLALRLGGQRGGAAAAGIIDTAGYLGATLAGSGVGRLADAYGWGTAFAALAGVAAATAVVAAGYALRPGTRGGT